MSLPPVTIPELDPAGPVDFNNDQIPIRQGLNDKRVSPAQLQNFKLENFPSLNSPILPTDVILIGRNNGLGAYTNMIATPQRLGFLTGVVMWFYADTGAAPLYWTVQGALADRVLAVKGGSGAYANAGAQGTWQQSDVGGVPGQGLNINQIPNHYHNIICGKDTDNSNITHVKGTRNNNPSPRPRAPTEGINGSAKAMGACDPHNHGAVWRPAAAVGIVCLKTG